MFTLKSVLLIGCLLLSACNNALIGRPPVRIELEQQSGRHYLTAEAIPLAGTDSDTNYELGFWWTEKRPDKIVVTIGSSASRRVEYIALTLDDHHHELKIATDLFRPETDGLQRNPFLNVPSRVQQLRQFPMPLALAQQLLSAEKMRLTLHFLGDAARSQPISDAVFAQMKQRIKLIVLQSQPREIAQRV